jgi:transcriptional regulator with XRE-family HTH domain
VEKVYTKQIKQLGIKVKSLREGLALTQQELAEKCEIDIRSIQRIEKGEFGFGLHILFALATALEVEPQELLKDIHC